MDEQQPAGLPWGPAVSDGDLVRQFAAHRDQEAFAELVGRHGPMVLGVCRRILRHEQDVEDAFQATFLVLARRAAQVRWQASLANWLYGVACRTALKARTRRARSPESGLRNPEMIAADDPSPPPDAMTSPENLRLLDEHLHSLPDRYRAPLVLCYLQGKTRDEAAEALGLSVGAIKGRLERGREKLRKRLSKAGLTLPAALPLLAGALAESLVVPKPLAAAAVDAALTYVGGHLSGAALSPQAVTLAHGELTMFKTVTVLKCLAAALLVSGALGGLIAVAQNGTAPAESEAKANAEKQDQDLLGTWEVVTAAKSGQLDEKGVGNTFTFTPRQVTLQDKDDAKDKTVFRYTLNSSSDPKEIDLTLPEQKLTIRGIYEIEGERLILAWWEGEKPKRPTELVSRPRQGHEEILIFLRRKEASRKPADEANAAADRKQNEENIQGTWKIVEQWSHARQTDQEELHKEAAAGIRLVIGKTAMTFTRRGDADGEATKYTLDPSQTPKAIDFQVAEGQEPGPGIYELNGDTLRILFNDSEKDRTRRPTKLPTKDDPPGEECRYLVLQREGQKPADKAEEAPKVSSDQAAGTELEKLLQERQEVLKTAVDMAAAAFRAARGDYMTVLELQHDLFHAQLEQAATQEQKIALYKQLLQNMEEREEIAEQRVQSGRGSQLDLLKARAARLQAQIDLVRAQSAPEN